MILALIGAVVVLYLLQSSIYYKKVLQALHYHVTLSHEEVFAGDMIWLYENLDYDGSVALPYVKADSELPDGLSFLIEREGGARTIQEGYVESVFALNSHSSVKRRWRVVCTTRGEYTVGSALLVTNNLLGLRAISRRYMAEPSRANTIIVLPRTVELESVFSSSKITPGDIALPQGLYKDPLRRAGSRDYTAADSMNQINWKRSATQNKLMVHIEEFSASSAFHILLNMQSRDIEKDPTTPSVPYYVENNIITSASLFERIAGLDIPTALITNTFPSDCEQTGDESFFYSESFCGRGDLLELLRLLAKLPLKVSTPFEKMLDAVVADPIRYAPDGNLIVISSFLNQRMLNFYEAMKKQGVTVTFYITTTERTVSEFQSEAEIFTVYQNEF